VRDDMPSFGNVSLYSQNMGRGAEEMPVPFARDLHPEFGYTGSGPRRLARAGIIATFVSFGLIAGASSVALLMSESNQEPDPLRAMALAQPAEAPSGAGSILSPEISASNPGQALAGTGTTAPGGVKPRCQTNQSNELHCTKIKAFVRVRRPAPAANERPPIAVVPIGHRDDPAVAGAQPAAPAIAAIPETPESTAAVADAMPAVEAAPETPSPPVEPKKARTRHVQRHERDRRDYSHSYSYPRHQIYRGGYAGLW
jgi:hypothetical protein